MPLYKLTLYCTISYIYYALYTYYVYYILLRLCIILYTTLLLYTHSIPYTILLQEVDKSRKFIIQVHLEDDTFQIREPPVRNSGHKGGIFLSRCKLESHHSNIKPLQPSDIYLGATVEILSHQFIILNCDVFTFKYMEENSKLWKYCNLSLILSKIIPKKEIIQRIILTLPNLSQHKLNIDVLSDILMKSGLNNLVKQEVCTIFHAVDVTQLGSIKTTQFLKYIMDLK